jgi:DNA-binding response OmpR family regulator
MTVLLADPDADTLDLLVYVLRRAGYTPLAARDGAVARQLWESQSPTAVVAATELPTLSGWELCRTIRQTDTTLPVLLLASTAAESELVRGYEVGADHYLVKPFGPKQLLVRLGAVLRRVVHPADQPRAGWQRLQAGDLMLDPQWRRVTRGSETIHLTGIEFKVLYELVLHAGQVLPHELLTDRVWGYDAVTSTDGATLLKGHIRNLRKKLEPQSARPVYLQTVPGVGYTFCPHAPLRLVS